ncbi:MarR family transcriptional regulator [Caniella muris]|uniref:MarR family transcriptional regulator n=1 Tax=Caniella muris TaxID=2941502 RepID=UPI00204208F9|nr:MarR family transcriptional regulator [Caniella muris]
MDKDRQDKERMLAAWLRVTTSVSQVHQLRDLRYNEALICNILMKNEIEHPGRRLTATDLCRESHILKSQMNRTLQCMEEKGIIERQRSTEDRRRVYTRLRPDSVIYERQHDQVLDTVGAIAARVGTDNVDQIVDMLNAISEAAEEVSRQAAGADGAGRAAAVNA